MKKILVALALLIISPATAATVILDLNPAVMSVEFPDFWNQLLADGARGAFITQAFEWDAFYASFPRDTLFVATNSAALAPFEKAFYVIDDYGTIVLVPEPSTWALLLLGFAILGFRRQMVKS